MDYRMLRHRRTANLTIAWVMAVLAWQCAAADWPTWLGDVSRSGSSEEGLARELRVAWAHRCRHAPSPAIPVPRGPAKSDLLGPAMTQTCTSDNAYQVVVAGGRLYLGSSTEESVTCLDAHAGEKLWTFYCEGAVRFAPICHEGKVYFGSDDGCVYCVAGASGKLVWKSRAALGKRRIIANQRICSQWPVRTGLTIRDGIVYAACGIFPSEDRGVMLYALRARDGEVAWKQRLLIHAMGHLLAEEGSLIVPAGRAAPLDVRRADGTRPGYRFFTRRDEGGGSPCTVAGMLVYGPNESAFLKVRTVVESASDAEHKGGASRGYDASRVPGRVTGLQGWRMVADRERIYVLRNDGLHALDRAAFTEALIASSREFNQRAKARRVFLKRHHQARDEPVLMEDMEACTKWCAPNKAGLVAMVRAGDQIITGGRDTVQAHRAADGERLWAAKVTGTVWDLAVSDGTVFASTDAGEIYCLREDGKWVGYAEEDRTAVFADERQKRYEDFAKRVLERADTRKGYCVVAGLVDGRLIHEVANQTEFFILGLDSDPKIVERVRGTLSSAGLYGKRVSIHQITYENLPYLSYFANVVLSESALTTGKLPCSAETLSPMVQPCGGLMVMAGNTDAKALEAWKVELLDGQAWAAYVRPRLGGAGEWTHMFADPANTLCSGDRRVGGTRYDIQWIGPPGTERQWGWHDNSMTSLYKDGRMYLTRRDHVMAVDAYNGTILWGLDVPGSLRLGVGHESGQACVDADFLYVAATNDCWLVDVATGRKVRAYAVPQPSTDWGYVAIVGDLLLGSCQHPKATINAQNRPSRPWGRRKKEEPTDPVRTVWGAMGNTQVVSTALFAVAKRDGTEAWVYQSSSHILNSSITAGDQTVFFLESRDPSLRGGAVGIMRLEEFFARDARLVALDLRSGAKKWEKPFKSRGEEVLYLSYSDGALLAVASANVPFEGEETDRVKNYYQLRLSDAATGAERWRRSVVAGKETYKHNVNIQPVVIMGDKAYLSMRTGNRLFTFDLATGEHTETPGFRTSKGCGIMSASATALFFRNMVSQTYDTVSGRTA